MDESHDVIALIIAYDGGPFAGFQAQPGRETVQGRLESALATVLGRQIDVTCAGRTDSGVHALGQVVSFQAEGDEPGLEALRRSVDSLVGPDIVVRLARRAVPGFSARHSALAREYRYRIATGPVRPLFLADVSWWVKTPLDLDAMRAAGETLVGEHDYTSFCVTESARDKPTVREVLRVGIEVEHALGEEVVAVTVEGRSFLHSMVRIIVGSLVEVGRVKHPSEWVAQAMAARDRTAAGPTAPPQGLVLSHVTYAQDVWL